jgi:hypothetical protein
MTSTHSTGRHLFRLVPAMLIAVAAACGPLRRGVGPQPAVIVFANESLAQATVYVAAPGLGARRIGTVMAGRTDTLTIPGTIATRGSVTIVARLLAHPRMPQTGLVSISPGEWYEVRLPSDAILLSFLPAR